MNTENVRIDKDGDLIFTTVGMYKLFLSHGKAGMEAYALYNHLFFTARLQETNQPYANTSYLQKGLGWGEKKVKQARALLKKLGLVDFVSDVNETGQFKKWYVKLNFAWTNGVIERKKATGSFATPVVSHPSGFDGQILKINNENALNKKVNITGDGEKPVKPETTEKKPPKNDLEKIENRFVEVHKQEYGIEPEIAFGKARKLEKSLLKRHSAEVVCSVIDAAAKDSWIKEKNTFELSTILSASVFNRLMRNGCKEKASEDKECPECGENYVGSCCRSCGWSA